MYTHFLLTRFNLKRHPLDKFGRETLTDEWMIERFVLFEKYCVPSVMYQSVRNFRWLVFFDANTSKKHRDRIESYNTLPYFEPVYLHNPVNKQDISDAVKSRLSKNDKYVISTRVDNDDSIHRDLLAEVQHQFAFQDNCFIRFLYGYQWHTDTNILLKMYEKFGNHFSSRIERIENGVGTVINVDNTKLSEVNNSEILDISDKKNRLWLEVVHNSNVANHYRVLLPEFRSVVLKGFNMNLRQNQMNSIWMLVKYCRKTLLG